MENFRAEQRIVGGRAVSGPANGILGDVLDVKAGSQDTPYFYRTGAAKNYIYVRTF
jgi:hypothetical protein